MGVVGEVIVAVVVGRVVRVRVGVRVIMMVGMGGRRHDFR